MPLSGGLGPYIVISSPNPTPNLFSSEFLWGSIAPTTLGSLYSWSLTNEGTLGYPFNHHFSFVLTGFAALITLVITVFLPDKFPAQNLIEVTESEVTNHSSSDEGPECEQDTKI
eukprot:gene6324-11751_t